MSYYEDTRKTGEALAALGPKAVKVIADALEMSSSITEFQLNAALQVLDRLGINKDKVDRVSQKP